MSQLGLFGESPKKRSHRATRRTLSTVPHRRRPEHNARHPILVTIKLVRGLPSLRSQLVLAMIWRVVAHPRFEGFRVVHFTVQSNHLHVILEAPDKKTLTSGAMSFEIRFAKRLNKLLERKGRVIGERYHRADLTKPRHVRNALRYVLANFKKHGHMEPDFPGVDLFSTGLLFDGWDVERMPTVFLTDEDVRPPSATTWLLRKGWRRHGLIRTDEAPAMAA
jgi:REP-associated tyrosine transposase